MHLFVPKSELLRFRASARKYYPKEYGELFYGSVSKRQITIREFVRVPFLNGAYHWWTDWSKIPRKRGRWHFLGAIHSHPDCPSCEPSAHDWNSASEIPEIVIGICIVNPTARPQTEVSFFRGLDTLLTLRYS